MLLDDWVVCVVCSKHCVWHRKSTDILVALLVCEYCTVFSWVVVVKYCAVVSHCFDHRRFFINCTSNHEIHAQSIFCLVPKLQTFIQVVSFHHDVPHSQSPLESLHCLKVRTLASFMDCNSLCWNACQGANQARKSQNSVRNLLFNVEDND